MPTDRPFGSALPVLMLLLIAGCEKEPTEPPSLQSIRIDPEQAVLNAVGDTARFTVVTRWSDGSDGHASGATWIVDSGAEVVSPSGVPGEFIATASGAARVIATIGELSDTAAVSVEQVLRDASIHVSQRSPTVGTLFRAKVEPLDSNGNPIPMEPVAVSWRSTASDVLALTDGGNGVAANRGASWLVAEIRAGSVVASDSVLITVRTGWTDIAVGTLTACALDHSGTAYCWGFDRYGTLGDGPGSPEVCGAWPCSRRPTKVQGDLTFVKLAAGLWPQDFCGLTTEGSLYCWGYNGVDHRAGVNLALGVKYGPDVCEVIQDALPLTVYCAMSPTPVAGSHVFSDFDLVNHGCGLTQAQDVFCWGLQNTVEPVPVVHELPTLSGVRVGLGYSCGISATSALICWGHEPEDSPIELPSVGPVTAFSAGELYQCAIRQGTRSAICWGQSLYGKLGNGSQEAESCSSILCTPHEVVGGHLFSDISAGRHTACGVTVDARIYCWGLGSAGQLGDGQTGADHWSSEPVPVIGDIAFKKVSVSHDFACGLAIDRSLYCWGGANLYGERGNSSAEGTRTPTRVAEPR